MLLIGGPPPTPLLTLRAAGVAGMFVHLEGKRRRRRLIPSGASTASRAEDRPVIIGTHFSLPPLTPPASLLLVLLLLWHCLLISLSRLAVQKLLCHRWGRLECVALQGAAFQFAPALLMRGQNVCEDVRLARFLFSVLLLPAAAIVVPRVVRLLLAALWPMGLARAAVFWCALFASGGSSNAA